MSNELLFDEALVRKATAKQGGGGIVFSVKVVCCSTIFISEGERFLK